MGRFGAARPLQMPMVRILERLGQQVRALGAPQAAQLASASALLGLASACRTPNARLGRQLGGDREAILLQVAEGWVQLDADAFPFTRSIGRSSYVMIAPTSSLASI
jgi:hypothetical protein